MTTYTPLVAIECANSHDICIAYSDADDIILATVHPYPFTRASGETGFKPDTALAALFAAAPELLEALEAITNPNFQQAYRDGVTWAVMAQLKAIDAIAKARGG